MPENEPSALPEAAPITEPLQALEAPQDIQVPQEPQELPAAQEPTVRQESAARRLPRAAAIALATAGLLAVTATSAAVTVAVGKPDSKPRPVAAAPAPSASVSASASASPSASPSPTPTPTAAPAPSSTVHGTLDGNSHGGDIRFFLVPMPAGAESYGSSDGNSLNKDEVSSEFSNASDMPGILDSYGYQDDAAERRYRTADGQQEVKVRLLRFKSRAMAKEFADGMSFKSGDSFDIDGDDGAKGIMMKPEQEAWTGKMVGISFSGDIEYQVTVYVKGTPDKALLMDAMKRQRDRLNTSG